MELTVAYRDKKSFEAICRGHQWKIDAPAEYGGDDKAPTPIEVFISSLGSCIGMYILGYCVNAKLDATDLTIELDWEKLDSPSRIGNISVKINLPKVDIAERKKAILEVASKCSVHNTLLNPPKINIELNGTS